MTKLLRMIKPEVTYTTGELTKRKLVNAAGELAAERGIDNVSTRAVAEFSGENIGSIHYHFGGKSGLWVAVVKAAIAGGVRINQREDLDALENKATPLDFSKMIRKVLACEIDSLFRSGYPDWHSQVIYQLLQRDDELYELFRAGVLDPNMDYLSRLIQMINPELDDEEVFLHECLMKMPIFAHANYRKAMLKRLKVKSYSENYLKKMEDLLVRQTQLLFGLPEDV